MTGPHAGRAALPCLRPPWSKLIAVNANTGEIVWERVLGLNEALPEGKQLVGNSGSAGPDRDRWRPGVRRRDQRRRASARSTPRPARKLWVVKLPPATGNAPNANANPMTYTGEERQAARRGRSPVNVHLRSVYALPVNRRARVAGLRAGLLRAASFRTRPGRSRIDTQRSLSRQGGAQALPWLQWAAGARRRRRLYGAQDALGRSGSAGHLARHRAGRRADAATAAIGVRNWLTDEEFKQRQANADAAGRCRTNAEFDLDAATGARPAATSADPCRRLRIGSSAARRSASRR